MKILIIEDNRNLANSLVDILKGAKHSTQTYQNGLDGYNYWIQHKKHIDLVILDEMLPGKSGLDIITDIRKREISTPTIMLTAKSEIKHKVEGLRSGCDDYMTKPFDLDELLARISAITRRPKELQYNIVQISKSVCVDISARRVTKDSEEVFLTHKEFEILEYLISNSGIVISEAQILQHCFDFAREYSSNTIEVHIKNIRKKLFTNDARHVIKTIRGSGYILNRGI